MYFKTDFEVVC